MFVCILLFPLSPAHIWPHYLLTFTGTLNKLIWGNNFNYTFITSRKNRQKSTCECVPVFYFQPNSIRNFNICQILVEFNILLFLLHFLFLMILNIFHVFIGLYIMAFVSYIYKILHIFIFFLLVHKVFLQIKYIKHFVIFITNFFPVWACL